MEQVERALHGKIKTDEDAKVAIDTMLQALTTLIQDTWTKQSTMTKTPL